MSDIVIKVENLSKIYKLGTINYGTFADEMKYRFYKLIGKDVTPLVNVSSLPRLMEKGLFKALDNVSFEVKQGDVVGLVGGNGSGKSTLLKVLSRITDPSLGRAVIKGRVGSLLEVGTGFHPELTGRENIYLSGSILGMRKHEIKSKFDEIVAFSEIENFIDTPVKRYSSGMYVKLAFSVAAHLEPEILFVDEVLAVGDVKFQKKCLGKMDEISKQGRTILFVSHNMAAVRDLCSRCLLLRDGKLIDEGSAIDITDKYVKSSLQDGVIKTFPIVSKVRNVQMNYLNYDWNSDDYVITIGLESKDFSERLGVSVFGLNASGARVFASIDVDNGSIIDGLHGKKEIVITLKNLNKVLVHDTYTIDLSIEIPSVMQLIKHSFQLDMTREKSSSGSMIMSPGIHGFVKVDSKAIYK